MARKKSKRAPTSANRYARGPGRKVTIDNALSGKFPDLDAQERAAQRGYKYTTADLDKEGGRATSDFGTAEADLNQKYGRSLSDLITQRTQGQQDYAANLQTLARNYQRLGNTQAQQGRQAGLEGGFAAQAAQKRAANEKIEQAPIDLGFKRFMEGSKLAETRLGEDKQHDVGALGLDYSRGNEDRDITGQRAGTELTAYTQDINAARQAAYGKPLPTTTLPGAKLTGSAAADAFRRKQLAASGAQSAASARARARARKRARV